jgi:putative spermidine/putrescine transport system permease protein
MALLPLSIPGITLSIGLLAAHGQLRGHVLVLAGHLLYTLPFMIKVVTATLRGCDAEGLVAAARSLGAGSWRTLVLVIVPTLRHAMMVGSLLVFTVSWGEFNVSFLLNSGWPQTFPAVLYDTYVNQSIQVSSAATTIFLLVAMPSVFAVQWLSGGQSVEVEQGS